jgi:DNA-directed RNA polymerase subunit beta'
MFDVNRLSAIQIGLASPEKIREWSYGEVKKGETINYRSQKPERDGLFDEKIFGPTKDYECFCGKYKKVRHQGIICDRCEVEVTSKSVRRERMGHIELATPVSHIWYLKGIPSRMAQVIDVSPKDLEEVIYFVSYICLNAGTTDLLKYREVLDETTARSRFTDIINQIKEKLDETGHYIKVENILNKLDSAPADEIYGDLIGAIAEIQKEFDLNQVLTDDINLNDLVNDLKDEDSRDKLIEVINAIMQAVDTTKELTRCSTLVNRLKNPKSGFDFLSISPFISKYTGAEFGSGAEAVQRLLKDVDINAEFLKVQAELKETQGSKNQKRIKLIKRLEVLDAFRQSSNKPEWMILNVLPVIPPELRPMHLLDATRVANSDLNDLYRRVIGRNNRLKKWLEMKAPSVMIINEKRLIQEAVDSLIDNGRRGKPVTGAAGRPLKSLSNTLKGKQGRFRQNLLGKRVDYSGRSVIAVGPYLNIDQVGIPREMALQLFKPFLASKLVAKGLASSHKQAEKMVEQNNEKVSKVLDEVVAAHPVLLNRAPTLHRLGIQAFETKIVDGRAIRLHPLVTPAFNADFDGDQMAVHVPLSRQAIAEARTLMLGAKNILGPKDGKPVVNPTQDMVLGNYFLTIEKTSQDYLDRAEIYAKSGNIDKAEEFKLFATCEGKVFNDFNELMLAYQTNSIHVHNRIAIKASSITNRNFTPAQSSMYLITSVGKMILNNVFADGLPFINEVTPENIEATPNKFFVPNGTDIKTHIKKSTPLNPFNNKNIGLIINRSFALLGTSKTSLMLDKIKNLGFEFATKSGTTVALSDIILYKNKKGEFDLAEIEVHKLKEQFDRGYLSSGDRQKLAIKIWEKTTKVINDGLMVQFRKNPNSPIFMMFDSGARGKKSNFEQLTGMRGLIKSPSGETTEIPIKSSFREGMTIAEFFISTHGARKGGADTALKTAESGYLTRRLVDVAQDVIVREDDCGTDKGTLVTDIVDTKENKVIVPFSDRIIGRYPLVDIVNPKTKKVIVDANTMITELSAKEIIAANIKELVIRSLFGCQTQNGVCKKCYGRNLATGSIVELGEAIGIVAAQSIGEPGTQLTMRTFHTGGVAGTSDITQGLPRVQELLEARNPKDEALITEIAGSVDEIIEDKEMNRFRIFIKNDLETKEYVTSYGVKPRVKAGDKVVNGEKLTNGAINLKRLLDVSHIEVVQKYILKEIQKVFRVANDIEISDKHIEVIIRQMFKKVLIVEGGDTGLLPGTKYDLAEFTKINRKVLIDGGNPAVARPMILGITKASLETESFLSAASFQETTRVLTDAATKGKIDYLHGLKENVIIGKLIPAGTGVSPLLVEEEIIEETKARQASKGDYAPEKDEDLAYQQD